MSWTRNAVVSGPVIEYVRAYTQTAEGRLIPLSVDELKAIATRVTRGELFAAWDRQLHALVIYR